jgi:hypothetical protein
LRKRGRTCKQEKSKQQENPFFNHNLRNEQRKAFGVYSARKVKPNPLN